MTNQIIDSCKIQIYSSLLYSLLLKLKYETTLKRINMLATANFLIYLGF